MKWRTRGNDDHRGARAPMRRGGQRGGFAVGLIVGLLVGLAIALAVALWVTKVPVPFVNKVPQRTNEAAEAERNRQWDPNAGLASKGQPSRNPSSAPVLTGPPTPSAGTTTANLPPYVPPVPPPMGAPAPATPAAKPPAASVPKPAAASAPAPVAAATAVPPPAASTPTPVGTAPAPKPTAPAAPGSAADPFVYFVQAGAYVKPEDAEQQRARLAMQGFTAKVTEREQVGRTMYRVRLGPFDAKEAAETAQSKLQQSGVDAALVRVERSTTAASR